MSDEARIFVAGVSRLNDAGEITVTMQAWSTWDTTIATAVVEAMRSLLGDPEDEILLDDPASRKMHAAGAESGMVILKARDDP